MLPKLVLPVTFPSNVLPVDPQFCCPTSKTICIIEETPCYQPTGDNGKPIVGLFRFAGASVIVLQAIQELAISPTFYIPGKYWSKR